MIVMGEEKQYQIPFRYGQEEADRLERIGKMQRWSNKKNQAIKDALEIACDLLDFLDSINESPVESTAGVYYRLRELKTKILKNDPGKKDIKT